MKKVLFMGDDSLTGAAAYLGGVLAHNGIDFDYVPSVEALSVKKLSREYGLIIISDYPAKNISEKASDILSKKVEAGCGLLMIGGWASFYGLRGEYHNSPIAEILPVDCMTMDDRDNYCHGLIPAIVKEHAIIKNLPFNEPPVVCGYNKVTPKKGSLVVLALQKIYYKDGMIRAGKDDIPYLVTGSYGKGKTGAITSDFAPHWVGGLVDWGKKRVKAQAKGGNEIEVGDVYVQFIRQIMDWFLTTS
jgi:uncharacterized membrane protein